MDNPDISLQFFRYICDILGTEEVVNARRQILTVFDSVSEDKDYMLITSGSKAEGLDIDGSDIDVMFVSNVPVYEKRDSMKYVNECCIVMDVTDCKPGYTQLKTFTKNHSCCLHYCCEYKTGEMYVSSKRHRGYAYFGDDQITHGPCMSTVDGDYDLVSCFRCHDWLVQAKSWLSRSQYQWASKTMIDAIVSFGVLFVPIGCKNSPNVDFEWRISFSFAEKLLIWSFNHIQLICYALLKMLLKEVIKNSTGDLLCSYFLKTIMFWVCEEKKSYQWEAKNMLSCFMFCLKRLIYCVQYETCVHYFIPENDLFEKRFNSQEHTLLLSTLNQLRNMGWRCLLETKTLRSLNSFIHPYISPTLYCGSFLPFLTLLEHMVFSFRPSFSTMKSAVFCRMKSKQSNFLISIVSRISQVRGQHLSKEGNKCFNNIQLYRLYRNCLSYLLIGLNNDAVSGWLIVASFFYEHKQFYVCRNIISDCLLRCTSDKYLLHDKPTKDVQTHFELLRRTRRIKPYIFIKTHSIRVVMIESCSELVPKEMNITEPSCHVKFSPVLFGLFLKYLCNHHLDIQREKVQSLRELEMALIKKYFINDDIDLQHQLIAIAYSLIDDHHHNLRWRCPCH